VQEAVVFEASSAEECVEGVHGPLPGNAFGLNAIDIGGTLLGALWILVLGELDVPGRKNNRSFSYI